MKPIKTILFFILILLLNGCYSERKVQENGADVSRESTLGAFIELKDGTRMNFEKLKIKSPPLQYQYLVGDGKKLDIDVEKILAFQTEDYYAFKVYDQKAALRGKLPFSELFAVRIASGKIELFVVNEMQNRAYGSNGSAYVKTYFLRKGKNTPLVGAAKEILKKMISDNKMVLEEFDHLYTNKYKFKSTMAVLAQYN